MYLNKVFLIGNLTRDPELKAIPSGAKVATFGIATNRVWKDQSGARKEATDFHNIVAFGRPAETMAQYLHKGSSVMIEGRIQTRSWEGQDGKKNYRTEIIVEGFQFGPRTGGAPSSAPTKSASDAEVPQKDAPADLDTIEYPDEEINLEDIPF
ncbi:MAG TPA: single-stranded DNA-binding protein [Candidatus Paceibacterota bacterium]|nr:single-stranded DNA-binding protein [Candidatus Paceibacterota bacterium]